MTRYRLRVPQQGDELYGDGDVAIVADTIEVARDCFRDHTPDEQEPIYLHPYIGRCQVLYKRDIDAGEGYDGAEPGDTMVCYCPDDGRELDRSHECLVWQLGRPDFHWDYDYTAGEPIDASEVPVGCTVHHPVLGSGRTVAKPRGRRGYGCYLVDCRFAWPDFTGPVRTLLVAQLQILRGPHGWPGDRRRVTVKVDGEVVAERVTPWAADVIRDLRIARLGAEWEAAMFQEYVSAREAVAS